jgi:DNA-directed RNA polymerase specialized sigma24 family protein
VVLNCKNLVELLGYYSSQTKWIERVKQALSSRRAVTEPYAIRGIVRRLDPDAVSALVEGYRAGATVYELADRFKIHRVTVSQHLHRQRVKMRRQGLDGRQVTEAARLYEEGWSLAQIASHYEVHPGTVWRALRARGIRMRDTHGRA